MKLYFILLLSWRYFRSIWLQRASSFLLRMSWISICLTTLIVALSISLFNGFHQAMYTTMQGINAPFFIEGFLNKQNYKQIKNFIASTDLINQWTPLWQSYVLIDNKYYSLDALCILQAVESTSYMKVTSFAKTVRGYNTDQIENILKKRQLIVGEALAQKYGLKIGDSITILYLSSYENYSELKFDKIQLTLGAITKTGLEELDAALLVCSKEVFKELWPDKLPESIGVRLNQPLSSLSSSLRDMGGAYCYSWQDLYPSLMSALYLEKIALYLFLGLLTLLSSMSIACSILMIINYKRVELALLSTIGASIYQLSILLGCIGLLITLSSAGVGCLLAFIISCIFSHYIPIRLPSAYYADTLPFDSSLLLFLGVFFFVSIISLLSIVWAGAQVRTLHPAHTLRFER